MFTALIVAAFFLQKRHGAETSIVPIGCGYICDKNILTTVTTDKGILLQVVQA